jgi:hypothetical protein
MQMKSFSLKFVNHQGNDWKSTHSEQFEPFVPHFCVLKTITIPKTQVRMALLLAAANGNKISGFHR